MTEKQQLEEMNNIELNAYRNILIMSQGCLMSDKDRETNSRHLELVNEIIKDRQS
jgi:hypothetical protein